MRQLVDAIADGIPGVTVKDVHQHHDETERSLLTFQVDLDCWAPSMHTREYSMVISPPRHLRSIEMIAGGMDAEQAERQIWEMKPDHADMPGLVRRITNDAALMREVVEFVLSDVLDGQRVISEAAADSGIGKPLGRGGDRNGIRIDHLNANTALLDLLCDTLDPSAAWRLLQEGTLKALLEAEPYPSPWYMTQEDPVMGGTCTILVTRNGLVHLDVPASLGTQEASRAGVRYDRDGICIPIGVPHTLLDAAVGGPLGAIIVTGRADLDGCEVIHWSEDVENGLVHLGLDLPVCRIGDHPRMRAPG